jgi:hypothetical protein
MTRAWNLASLPVGCLGVLLMAACGGAGSGADVGPGGDIDVPLQDLPLAELVGDGGRDPGGLDAVGEVPCIPDCATVGDRQCAPGVQGFYEVCAVGDGGCLLWGVAVDCGNGKACDGGQCLATCLSDPGCAKAGDRRCGTAIAFQECVEAAAGCFKYGEDQACPDAQTCVGDGACECQHSCPTVGDRRCFTDAPNLYQACAENPAGCRVWGAETACEGTAVCKGAGVCEDVCVGDCANEGDLACASGTAYQMCQTRQPGCLKWGQPVACPGALTCGGGECQVACVSDAACTAAGVTGCTTEGLQRTCEEVAPGCLKLGVATACPLHQACAGSACACESPCAEGESDCSATDARYRKVCTKDEASCTFWDYEDCGGGSNCAAGVCVAICGSDPGCGSAGVTRCESRDAFATCAEVAGHPGCIQFGASAACPAHQECQDATGACACRVEAACTAVDAKRCIDYDNRATCTQDEAGCLYWGAPEACPVGNTCSDGVCGPLCVSDLDCPTAGTNRCTVEGLLQTCVDVPDAPGCIKWAPPQACPTHKVCVDGTGCACDNPCVADQSRCIGLSQRQTCAAPDPLGCTSWSDPQACGAGDSCVQGACHRVVSPVIECGSVTLNLVNQGWSQVEVRGNFQGTTWVAVPAVLTGGIWTATVVVTTAGRYEYKFVADGTWVKDPLNPDSVLPMDNSVATVEFVRTCDILGAGRCTTAGALETCQENHGCTAWLPPADPCTAADRYCEAGACHPIVSPVVTDTSVAFTVRDQGYPVEVGGDFTSPTWGVFFLLAELPGRRTTTLLAADVPGLAPGKHVYKFRVSATGTWFFDPSNPLKEGDGEGGFNSVFTMPTPCVPGCDTPGATRCKDTGHVETCGVDAYGCAAWNATPCDGGLACLRQRCEGEPVIDAIAKTATFVYVDDGSATVKVTGDFLTPSWDAGTALALTKTGGVWVATTSPLASGTWKYKILKSDGATTTWIRDPFNSGDDGSNDHNNLFTIP